ncbi:unnamed protein product [Caenorhabditis sp. 36 PRJEB53466]|nr:unnamed protein product [Caenorhabditis sp. 36 PRJEB53466]
MHNNGFSPYQQFPTSFPNPQMSRQEQCEWSARDESWRGWNSRNERSETWTPLGRDRAPAVITDQFLASYGAKRLSNGNLMDSNGFTLRVRDPHCQAPSPPLFNPGRAERVGRGVKIDNLSAEDLDRSQKARKQIQMMRKLEKEKMRRKRRQERKDDEQEKNANFVPLGGRFPYKSPERTPTARKLDNNSFRPLPTPTPPLSAITTSPSTSAYTPSPSHFSNLSPVFMPKSTEVASFECAKESGKALLLPEPAQHGSTHEIDAFGMPIGGRRTELTNVLPESEMDAIAKLRAICNRPGN